MENYKTIPAIRCADKFSEIKQATDAKHQNSAAHVLPTPATHFDMIEFIRQSRKDSTFLMAFIR